MDEGDSEKNNQKIRKQREQIGALSRYIIDAGNVFSTFGVRCTIQAYDGYNRLILGSRRGLLLNFRLFLVGIYLAYQAFK
jgi:argininosuccinate synthase